MSTFTGFDLIIRARVLWSCERIMWRDPIDHAAPASPLLDYPYVWRVRTRIPERFGQRCRVIARGALNNAQVEFPDGYWVITSRNYLRRAT